MAAPTRASKQVILTSSLSHWICCIRLLWSQADAPIDGPILFHLSFSHKRRYLKVLHKYPDNFNPHNRKIDSNDCFCEVIAIYIYTGWTQYQCDVDGLQPSLCSLICQRLQQELISSCLQSTAIERRCSSMPRGITLETEGYLSRRRACAWLLRLGVERDRKKRKQKKR